MNSHCSSYNLSQHPSVPWPGLKGTSLNVSLQNSKLFHYVFISTAQKPYRALPDNIAVKCAAIVLRTYDEQRRPQ